MTGWEEMVIAYITTHEAIVPLVDGRIYPLVMPQQSAYPAITYQTISDPERWSKKDSDRGFYGSARMQLMAVARTYAQATAIRDAVRDALRNWSAVGSTETIRDVDVSGPGWTDFDPQTGEYSRMIDVKILHVNTT